MLVDRRAGVASQAEVIEHILDKGIVIDGWARVSLAGVFDLLTIETRVVVASIQTYLKYSDSFSHALPVSWSVPSAITAASLRQADHISRGHSVSIVSQGKTTN